MPKSVPALSAEYRASCIVHWYRVFGHGGAESWLAFDSRGLYSLRYSGMPIPLSAVLVWPRQDYAPLGGLCFRRGDNKMADYLIGILQFAGALFVAVGLVKYVFKSNPLILIPAYVFMTLYLVDIFLLERLTVGKDEGSLFLIWNLISAGCFIASLVLAYRQRVPLYAFMASLLFQIPFCFYVWYSAGYGFTHKS